MKKGFHLNKLSKKGFHFKRLIGVSKALQMGCSLKASKIKHTPKAGFQGSSRGRGFKEGVQVEGSGGRFPLPKHAPREGAALAKAKQIAPVPVGLTSPSESPLSKGTGKGKGKVGKGDRVSARQRGGRSK